MLTCSYIHFSFIYTNCIVQSVSRLLSVLKLYGNSKCLHQLAPAIHRFISSRLVLGAPTSSPVCKCIVGLKYRMLKQFALKHNNTTLYNLVYKTVLKSLNAVIVELYVYGTRSVLLKAFQNEF